MTLLAGICKAQALDMIRLIPFRWCHMGIQAAVLDITASLVPHVIEQLGGDVEFIQECKEQWLCSTGSQAM